MQYSLGCGFGHNDSIGWIWLCLILFYTDYGFDKIFFTLLSDQSRAWAGFYLHIIHFVWNILYILKWSSHPVAVFLTWLWHTTDSELTLNWVSLKAALSTERLLHLMTHTQPRANPVEQEEVEEEWQHLFKVWWSYLAGPESTRGDLPSSTSSSCPTILSSFVVCKG